MPANVDESLWERAKKIATKQGKSKNYALIMHIYQKMKGEKSDNQAEEVGKAMGQINVVEELEKLMKAANHDLVTNEALEKATEQPDMKDVAQKIENPDVVEKSLVRNNLHINLSAEDDILEMLDGGMVVGGQSAGLHEDGRHRLLGQRGERMTKGTVHQGEYDGSRGGDFREETARAQCLAAMVELDEAGNAGQGGLSEWFEDSWSDKNEASDLVNVPLGMGPKASGWEKAEDQKLTIIDDDDPYTKSQYRCQHGEHQSSSRLAYQGDGRENKR